MLQERKQEKIYFHFAFHASPFQTQKQKLIQAERRNTTGFFFITLDFFKNSFSFQRSQRRRKYKESLLKNETTLAFLGS